MANENKTSKEYVQKGYLIAHLANCGIRTINYDEWERLCKCIHEAKPADVVEVAHGEWIIDDASIEHCSVCKHRFYISALFAVGGNDEPPCCPNCGADMRGGHNEQIH